MSENEKFTLIAGSQMFIKEASLLVAHMPRDFRQTLGWNIMEYGIKADLLINKAVSYKEKRIENINEAIDMIKLVARLINVVVDINRDFYKQCGNILKSIENLKGMLLGFRNQTLK